MDKVDYVLSQPKGKGHFCHWPNCGKEVPPAMWGCRQHWFMLPKSIRDEIWRFYKIGQEISKDPSNNYIIAAHNAQDWISKNYGK